MKTYPIPLMKIDAAPTQYQTLALYTGTLLTLVAATHAPAAQAAVACEPEQRTESDWGNISANFYEVPLGRSLTSRTVTFNNLLVKTNDNVDRVYREATGGALGAGSRWIGAPVNGWTLPEAPGLALRIRLQSSVPSGAALPFTGSRTEVGSGQYTLAQNVQNRTTIVFEIVRATEEIDGSAWQITAGTRLPMPLTITLNTQDITAGTPSTRPGSAANCPIATFNTFSDLRFDGLRLPPTPPPAITCTLNFDNNVVDFGRIDAKDLHTYGQPPEGFARRPISIHYACQNASNPATPNYTIRWSGDPAAGYPTALQVIDSNNNQPKTGLGIVMETDANPPTRIALGYGVVAPNAGRAGGSNLTLYAYPIRAHRTAPISAGPFKATATLKVHIY